MRPRSGPSRFSGVRSAGDPVLPPAAGTACCGPSCWRGCGSGPSEAASWVGTAPGVIRVLHVPVSEQPRLRFLDGDGEDDAVEILAFEPAIDRPDSPWRASRRSTHRTPPPTGCPVPPPHPDAAGARLRSQWPCLCRLVTSHRSSSVAAAKNSGILSPYALFTDDRVVAEGIRRRLAIPRAPVGAVCEVLRSQGLDVVALDIAGALEDVADDGLIEPPLGNDTDAHARQKLVGMAPKCPRIQAPRASARPPSAVSGFRLIRFTFV